MADVIKRTDQSAGPGTSTLTGAFVGFMTAYSLKKIGPAAGYIAGAGILLVQWLAYVGVLSIDYTAVKTNTFSTLDADNDGTITTKDVVPFFKNVAMYFSTRLPFTTGAILGWLGGLQVADEGFYIQGKQLL